MSSIDEIVKVTISIDTPTATGDDYSGMLIIFGSPENTGETPDTVQEIKYPSDVVTYGYTTDSDEYKVAWLVLKQNPCPENVFFTIWDSSSDSITDVLDTAKATSGWYGFVMVDQSSGSNMLLAANWAEENEKLFGFSYCDSTIPVDITDFYRTFALYYTGEEDNEYNEWGVAAWMSKCLGYEPGSETWGLKTLAKIDPSGMTASQIEAIFEVPANCYNTYANKNITREGKVGAGEWIDIIRLRDFLKSEIQTAVFDYLTENAKVPYDDNGITGIENCINGVLQAAQTNGGIMSDWEDDDGETVKGYTITVPLAKDVAKTDRAARKLTGVKFQAYLTGAIHVTEIEGVLEY